MTAFVAGHGPSGGHHLLAPHLVDYLAGRVARVHRRQDGRALGGGRGSGGRTRGPIGPLVRLVRRGGCVGQGQLYGASNKHVSRHDNKRVAGSIGWCGEGLEGEQEGGGGCQ